ncbi:hypothetical protein ABEB36_011012 [Hypothenemus hampei]|uniref:Uncharacterized protein n=1 Tax=Hypothenemus hampei TaxID=57062 RepID=A0ABD1EE42_HYPHA
MASPLIFSNGTVGQVAPQIEGYVAIRLKHQNDLEREKGVDAFKSKDNHNLLIIECESEALENQLQEIEELYNNLDGISLNKLIEESDERSKQIIDGNTLVQLISNEEIEIGSKPPGTSDLEGAYSEVFEEVEFTTFVDKLLLEKLSDVYIISGILGSDKESELIKSINGNIEVSKINDLKSQIALFNPQNIKRTIDRRIQVADDQFKEKDFKQICHNNPERKIYWIILKNEDDKSVFILAQIYNPDFYLNGQRFNNEVVIEKDIKEELVNSTFSEIFIIDVKDKSEVTEWLQFNNIFEQTLLEKNC